MLRRLAVAAMLLLSTACNAPKSIPNTPTSHPTTSARLPNGLYAVIDETAPVDADRFVRAGYTTRIYRDRYGEPPDPPRVVALDAASPVSLDLEVAPATGPDGRGHALLSVTLRRNRVAALRELTRAHLGGRVAIVVDDEIVTIHKVRAVIEDGRMQITRCTDDACDVLRSKLASELTPTSTPIPSVTPPPPHARDPLAVPDAAAPPPRARE